MSRRRNIMIIAPATRADLDNILTLVNAAYRGIGAKAGWTSEDGIVRGTRVDAASVESLLTQEQTVILLMRREPSEQPIGCIVVRVDDDATCELSMFAIHPDVQAAGYGRTLLTAAETYAYRHGARLAELTVVHLRESLIAWYERQGYRRTGATKAFPYQDPSLGQPLRDDLYFVVLSKALSAD
jgi:ribosomal protein S18 acetylase RimI-like enzyme